MSGVYFPREPYSVRLSSSNLFPRDSESWQAAGGSASPILLTAGVVYSDRGIKSTDDEAKCSTQVFLFQGFENYIRTILTDVDWLCESKNSIVVYMLQCKSQKM